MVSSARTMATLFLDEVTEMRPTAVKLCAVSKPGSFCASARTSRRDRVRLIAGRTLAEKAVADGKLREGPLPPLNVFRLICRRCARRET